MSENNEELRDGSVIKKLDKQIDSIEKEIVELDDLYTTVRGFFDSAFDPRLFNVGHATALQKMVESLMGIKNAKHNLIKERIGITKLDEDIAIKLRAADAKEGGTDDITEILKLLKEDGPAKQITPNELNDIIEVEEDEMDDIDKQLETQYEKLKKEKEERERLVSGEDDEEEDFDPRLALFDEELEEEEDDFADEIEIKESEQDLPPVKTDTETLSDDDFDSLFNDSNDDLSDIVSKGDNESVEDEDFSEPDVDTISIKNSDDLPDELKLVLTKQGKVLVVNDNYEIIDNYDTSSVLIEIKEDDEGLYAVDVTGDYEVEIVDIV